MHSQSELRGRLSLIYGIGQRTTVAYGPSGDILSQYRKGRILHMRDRSGSHISSLDLLALSVKRVSRSASGPKELNETC